MPADQRIGVWKQFAVAVAIILIIELVPAEVLGTPREGAVFGFILGGVTMQLIQLYEQRRGRSN